MYLPEHKEWAIIYKAYSSASPAASSMFTKNFLHFKRVDKKP